jgi:hypothetical protein
MSTRWITAGIALLTAGCSSVDIVQHRTSSNAARVRGVDVAALFTRPVKPALDYWRARDVRCRFLQETPGRGGSWAYWDCRLKLRHTTRQVRLAWQFDPRSPETAVINATDAQTGTRRTECCAWQPRTRDPSRVESLFTKPFVPLLNPGDGVVAIGCKPTRDRPGLGNPWRCTLDLDSAGTTHETVLVRPDGSFRSEYSGGGCCLRVSPAAR